MRTILCGHSTDYQFKQKNVSPSRKNCLAPTWVYLVLTMKYALIQKVRIRFRLVQRIRKRDNDSNVRAGDTFIVFLYCMSNKQIRHWFDIIFKKNTLSFKITSFLNSCCIYINITIINSFVGIDILHFIPHLFIVLTN